MTTQDAKDKICLIEADVLKLTYATLTDNVDYNDENHPAIVKLRNISNLLAEIKADIQDTKNG